MSLINLFLKSELTCIPSVLNKILGNYYNNALCNAATWIFLIWSMLHFSFDSFLNGLLKKMKYKRLIRDRLKRSLWYLGFYTTALIYSGASLYRDSVELFRFRIMHLPYDSDMPGQSVIGLIVLIAFFIHSAMWESLKYGSVDGFSTNSLLALFLLLTHFLRTVEASFSLVAIISMSHICINLTQCVDVLMHNTLAPSFLKVLLGWDIVIMIVGYILMSSSVALPFIIKMASSYPNVLLYSCFGVFVSYMVTSFYNSVLHRLVNHWLNHSKLKPNDTTLEATKTCPIVDCVLYPARNDEEFILNTLRKEAKQRATAKAPNARNRFVQTLKCILTMKRKVQQKRLAELNKTLNEDSIGSEEEEGLLSDGNEADCPASFLVEEDSDFEDILESEMNENEEHHVNIEENPSRALTSAVPLIFVNNVEINTNAPPPPLILVTDVEVDSNSHQSGVVQQQQESSY